MPHVGFSHDMRRINLRISASILGRPGFLDRDFHRQYNLKPCWCQRTTVSGWTMTRTERQFDENRDSQAQKIRSRLRSRGRYERCSRIARCCRKARFSAASSDWLRRSDRRKTKIICIQPIIRSQRLYLYYMSRAYERSRGGERVNRRYLRKQPKRRFSVRIRFSGGTAKAKTIRVIWTTIGS